MLCDELPTVATHCMFHGALTRFHTLHARTHTSIAAVYNASLYHRLEPQQPIQRAARRAPGLDNLLQVAPSSIPDLEPSFFDNLMPSLPHP